MRYNQTSLDAFLGCKVIHRAQIFGDSASCKYVFVRIGEGE